MGVLALIALPLLVGCTTAAPGGEEDPVGYPADCRSIDLLLGLSAGGASDLAFRLLGEQLEAETGIDVQPLNVTGGGGIVAISQLLATPADGCTLGYSSIPSHLQYLFPESPAEYDKDDFSLVGGFGRARQVLVVKADSPYQTLDDVIEAGRENGRLNVVADSPIGTDAVINAQLAEQTGVNIQQVIVGGGAEKVATLLGDQVDFMNGALATVKGNVEAGELRILAVWSEDPAPGFEDVPTSSELGLDILAESRYGLVLAAGAPEEVRQALEDLLALIAENPEYQQQNTDLGIETEFVSGEEYSAIWDEMAATIESVDLSVLD